MFERSVGEPAVPAPGEPEHRLILIADDEAMVRQLIEATLADGPYRVLTAATGDEALHVTRLEHPHVILLDVGLPGVDGYTVCKVLKSEPRTSGVKVVMLTARAQRRDRERGVAAGADAYVTKPFSPRQLLAEIQTVLDG